MARTARARTSPRTAGGPQPRPLPRNPQRTAGDFVKAFLAFIALAVLLIGVPGSLAYFVGWPLPHQMPSMDTVRQPITAGIFIKVLTVVVWLAWAQFTACVLVEGKAELSGVGMPSRIPGAGPSQLLARQLVAALLLVGATAASLTPGLSQMGNAYDANHRSTVAAAQQTPGAHQQAAHRQAAHTQGQDGAQSGMRPQGKQAVDPTASDRAEGAARHAGKNTKFYRIQPPEGRHHDSLWEIADRHLGDGRRYKEIYELNKDRLQPDGSKLSQASLIRPGWIMEMPADARGGELVEMPDEAPKVSPDVRQQIQDYDRDSPHADQQQGGGDQQQGGGQADPASDVHKEPVARPDQQRDDAGQAETATAGSSDSSFGLSEALIGAPLLAAGLLGALGRRRRAALWQAAMSATGRGSGIDLTPTGPAADAQDALLVGADPDAVRDLDSALRGLSAALADENRQLPTVYAAWLTAAEIHLQLAAPSGEPPAPWQPGQDQTFWQVRRADVRPQEPHEDDGTAAPYPGLVSLGTLDDARLLLNLEAVPGIVSLTGSEADRTALFASVAAELATNGWSDRLTVTLVGFGQELGALAPTRVRHVEDVDALIETMDAETRQRRGALGAAGHDSVLTGRTGRPQHTQRAPHLVLLAAEPTDEQAARLAGLAADSGRLGIGYLIGTGRGELPGATWELEITSDGRLLAPLLGLELTAQLLPEAQHRAVVDLFAAADPDAGPRPDGPDTAPPPFMVDITERGRPAVYARLVGPYEIIGLDTPDDDRSPLLHEALALLLLHREGVHPRVLASALWPRGATEDVRDALIERLRGWLGDDPDGTRRLGRDETGRLTLAASVVSDLDVLRTLHHEATEGRGARRASVRERLLTDALALARGPLLADRPEGRYGWLSHELIEAQLPMLVTDVALALSSHHLEANRAASAIESLNAALATAPADERLWNELLRAVHATGDLDLLQSTADSLVARNQTLNGGARGLPPRTEALLDELLPSWRGPRAEAN
ncbi:BTAD domain-containing putative transcriptional regulator [Streptomyces sp. NPDC005355]|uniref:BTAD domain-containing putative transcriptional regulator n=1 Tax=Streptomyces sp. NPDC005355 TaxID=3157038 RepID=UPI0033A3E7A8